MPVARYHMRRAMKELRQELEGRLGYLLTNKIMGHAESMVDAEARASVVPRRGAHLAT
jgi:hypothetical protein